MPPKKLLKDCGSFAFLNCLTKIDWLRCMRSVTFRILCFLNSGSVCALYGDLVNTRKAFLWTVDISSRLLVVAAP